jgi:hypothetical protein
VLAERFFHRTVNTKLEIVDRSCWYRVLSNSVSGPSRILLPDGEVFGLWGPPVDFGRDTRVIWRQ